MAGHSKWKNIRDRKGAQDAKKAKVFTKIATEIAVAVKLAGADVEANARLRGALLRASAANMPREDIERAVTNGQGDAGGATYAEKTYEGLGPAGVAFVVECLTDNVNRTVGDVRHGFAKFEGSLGSEGSVSWQFHKKGLFVFDRTKVQDFDALMDTAMENKAEDVREEEGAYEVVCAVPAFLTLKETLESQGFAADVAALTRIPENYVSVTAEQAAAVHAMIDWLEDIDDVQHVYHNADMPE